MCLLQRGIPRLEQAYRYRKQVQITVIVSEQADRKDELVFIELSQLRAMAQCSVASNAKRICPGSTQSKHLQPFE